MALLEARHVRGYLGVDLEYRANQVRALGEGDELDPGRRLGRDVGVGDVEHDLVLAPHLAEAAIAREPQRVLVILVDAAPERAETPPARVFRQRLVESVADAPAPLLGDDARHRVQAACKRRRPADADTDGLVA